MSHRILAAFGLGAALVLARAVPAQAVPMQAVPTPEEHLGRPVGADFQLAGWEEVSSYYRRLAERSPRVLLHELGRTTEGRLMILAVVSSEENLARLDEIRAASARIADPRTDSSTDSGADPRADPGAHSRATGGDGSAWRLGAAEREALLARARPVLFLSLGMHSNETAAPQFGMELAHRLATSDEEPYASARRELVVVILPCTNPDGLDHVVDWYRRTVGTPHEGSALPRLYQLYAGHDNNRDWFSLALAETRLVTEQLYGVWRPQVYWDVHQQGQARERMFLPPFRDPLNPQIAPSIIAAIDALGSRAMLDMTHEGLTGLSTGVTYDMWWNGGNRNVPLRHNVIGLLTEAASVDVASPVFLAPGEVQPPRGLPSGAPSNRQPAPWPGGWWRLRDVIDYEHAFARSLLASLAREPRLWLETTLRAAERAIARGESEVPRAWILPSDQPDAAAVSRLVDQLLLGGVELHVAGGPVDADGRQWPAGSIVILRAQPYGEHVQDLFATQRYPEGDPPYDVAGWTLPLLLGVERVEVVGEPGRPVQGALRRVTHDRDALAGFRRVESIANGETWRAAIETLARGESARLDAGGEALVLPRLPRIAVYSPWSGDMDEGWLRWVLDAWGLPFTRVFNEGLRAGRLREAFDVLVLAGTDAAELDAGRARGSVPPEFAGGLDPEGAVAVEAFVREGGRLVAIGGSAQWAIELFGLPLRDVTRGESAKGFSCPGSVVRLVRDAAPPADSVASLAAGLPGSMAVFFAGSAAWTVDAPAGERAGSGAEAASAPAFGPSASDVRVLMRYAPERLLLSGWIREPEVIEGHIAWAHVPVGRGSVQLFGFAPQYRGWSQAAFPLLFRALLVPG